MMWVVQAQAFSCLTHHLSELNNFISVWVFYGQDLLVTKAPQSFTWLVATLELAASPLN